MGDGILVLNAGSSSIKFAVYRGHSGQPLDPIARGKIEGINSQGSEGHFSAFDGDGKELDDHRWPRGEALTHTAALAFLTDWLQLLMHHR